VSGSDSDALALLIVRLDSDQPANGDLCWHPWDRAAGAEPHGLSEAARDNPAKTAPFKRYPGDDDWPYFNAHVGQLLFPPGNKRGARWVCCPEDLYLDLHQRGKQPRRAHIDLLERLTTPLQPGCTFGLIHLSLQPTADPEAPDSLWWAWAIRSILRHTNEPSRVVLSHGGEKVELEDKRSVRALVGELFGDPHRYLEQSLYTVLMAQRPDDFSHPDEEKEWRRALAKRRGTAKKTGWSERDEKKEDRQTVRFAGATGLILGNCTAFTLPGPVGGMYARNLRSYWAESIVFGLVQQECLEDFQGRLAEVGDPLKPEIEDLHRDWLSFRNLIWWSQLSTSTDVPQEIVSRLRNELGTERLFTDLEGDLATYSEQQHRVVEDEQAAALANLQVYGSGLVVLSTLATIIGLVEARGAVLASLVAAAFVISVAVSLFVRAQLRRA
jgi:hypothetical protein